MTNKITSSSDADPKPVVGTCMDMCPSDELQMRERKGLLHEFEITKECQLNLYRRKPNRQKFSDPDSRPKADKRKTIKSFSRPSAGQSMQRPDELRPSPVLLKTTDYLFKNVLNFSGYQWNIVYDFVFDRLRAIRQDMTIQCLNDKNCLTILEQCVRFHVYADYHFGEENVKLYDRHINRTHLRECLQSLLRRYDDLTTKEWRPNNRPLFESIYLVFNMGTNEPFFRYGALPKRLREHHMIKRSFRLSLDFGVGRYYQALQTINRLKPTILALAAASKISLLHSLAIRQMTIAYSSPNAQFPLKTLCQWLCPFESDQNESYNYLKNIIEKCGLEVKNDCVLFNKNRFSYCSEAFCDRKWNAFKYLIEQLTLSSVLRGRTENLFIEEQPMNLNTQRI